MHQKINSLDISRVYACIFRPVKSPMRTLYKLHGKVYHLELMKENDHRGTHAFTGLTFAPSVIMFS